MAVRIISMVDEAFAAIEAMVAIIAAKLAHDIEAWAKVHAPVDTGFLRSSIKAEPTGDAGVWIVQVGAEYAAYVELGTVHMQAQPFLLPAVETVRAAAAGSAAVGGPPSL